MLADPPGLNPQGLARGPCWDGGGGGVLYNENNSDVVRSCEGGVQSGPLGGGVVWSGSPHDDNDGDTYMTTSTGPSRL